jgi:hypothetical protein
MRRYTGPPGSSERRKDYYPIFRFLIGMAQIVTVEMECPRCHHTQEVEYWRSLNVTVDPERKEELLSGEINVFLCAECSFRSFLAAHFLYTDMDEKFSVLLVPWQLVKNDEYLRNTFTAEGKIRTRKGEVHIFQSLQLDYYRSPHIVFRMGDLISYILFRDKLAALHTSVQEKDG